MSCISNRALKILTAIELWLQMLSFQIFDVSWEAYSLSCTMRGRLYYLFKVLLDVHRAAPSIALRCASHACTREHRVQICFAPDDEASSAHSTADWPYSSALQNVSFIFGSYSSKTILVPNLRGANAKAQATESKVGTNFSLQDNS